MRILQNRLIAMWQVLTSRSTVLITQSRRDENPHIVNFGAGSIKDMVLIATAMHQVHAGFVDAITHMATESGELHALQELRSAIDVIEGETV